MKTNQLQILQLQSLLRSMGSFLIFCSHAFSTGLNSFASFATIRPGAASGPQLRRRWWRQIGWGWIKHHQHLFRKLMSPSGNHTWQLKPWNFHHVCRTFFDLNAHLVRGSPNQPRLMTPPQRLHRQVFWSDMLIKWVQIRCWLIYL